MIYQFFLAVIIKDSFFLSMQVKRRDRHYGTDSDGIRDVCDAGNVEIPTLSEWEMIIFMTMIMGIAAMPLRKRRMM